jgi:hypothetical protein
MTDSAQPGTPAPNQTGAELLLRTEQIRREIDERSKVLASLYAALPDAREADRDVLRQALGRGEGDEADTRRRLLQGSGTLYDSLSAQIRDVTRQVGELGAQLRAVLASAGADVPPGPTPAQREQFDLEKRLLEIADRQVDAVRRWNADPADARRTSFGDEMRRLHEEFSRTLERVNALRAAGRNPSQREGAES